MSTTFGLLSKFESPCLTFTASIAKVLGSDRPSKVMSNAVVSKTMLANAAANVSFPASAAEVDVEGVVEDGSSFTGIRTSSAICLI